MAISYKVCVRRNDHHDDQLSSWKTKELAEDCATRTVIARRKDHKCIGEEIVVVEVTTIIERITLSTRKV